MASLISAALLFLTVAGSVHSTAIHGAVVLPSPSYTNNSAYLIEAHNGAVASENEECSKIGVDVLKDHGNAVDAAVATTLCSGVMNMFSSGIGGGGFMTIRIGRGQVYNIDFRETAPGLANATMYGSDPNTSLYGGLAVGIPGELRGLEEAHKRWGKLPWKRLVTPSVKLAKGFTVGRELQRRITGASTFLNSDPDWTPIFAPNGTLLKLGDTVVQTNLSKTLSAIADGGADVFYKGAIAKSLIAKIQATGGIMTVKDLASYTVNVEKALQGTYRGQKVYTTQAPASGPALLHMLNILETYELSKEGLTPLNFHRMVEALKFGFAARTRIGDPAFLNATALKAIAEIPTKEFGLRVARNVTDNTTHPPEYYNPVTDVQIDHGTMHLVTVDKDRTAVSLTSTVNLVFGSRVLDTTTGVILNDELDDFSRPGIPNSGGLYPSPYNYPAPFKRPLSSIVPTIFEHSDGSFLFAVGAAGGTRIYTAVLQTILGALDYGLNVSAAIEAPRAHHTLYPNIADLDNAFKAELVDGLRVRGHNVTLHDINEITSSVQAVKLQKSTLFAASDARKNGVAAGY